MSEGSVTIKTLHLTNSYHPDSGGIRTVYGAMLRAAERERRAVRLVVPGSENRIESPGRWTRVYHVRAARVPVLDSRYRYILPHRYVLPFGRSIRPILREERPDLIEVCDKYALCHLGGLVRRGSIRGLQRPTVVSMSCERMDDNVAAYLTSAPAGERFARWYMRSVYAPQFDYLLANSAYTARELVIALGESERIRIVPCGVDVERFRPGRRAVAVRESLRREAGGGSGAILLLYVGRINPEKNVALLPRVVARLAREPGCDARLVVAGDGPLRETFARECRKVAPGRVALLGHVRDPDRLAAIYASCDVFLHPNPREPFGIAPLEAMASGLPLVAPRTGGVRSYATDANAWLAPPLPEAFAVAVRRILTDPVGRLARVGRALRTAEAYRWETISKRQLDLYERLHAERLEREGDAPSTND